MFADCTHIIVSLLKACKVTVVRTEYDYAIISPEIVIETKNYKKAKMKGGPGLMTKYRE